MSRILIIEDEEAIAELEKDYLEMSGFETVIETSGDKGLELALNEDYALVILDLMLPGLDGFAVCRAIREKKNTPIIMVSAKKDDIDKIRGLGLGADDYMTKPFSTKELLARVRAMTRRQPELSDSVLKFGNLSLDRSDYELAGPDGSTKLANKEFQIMEMLMTNPGQVISTERFLEKIWGYDTDAEVNVVWVYISTLRKKLANLGTSVQIKAARGVGYSLEDKA